VARQIWRVVGHDCAGSMPRSPERDGQMTSGNEHVRSAAALLEKREIALASVEAQAALRAGNLDFRTQLAAGAILLRCNEFDVARSLYRELEDQHAHDLEVCRGLASVHRFFGDVEKAEAACERILAACPTDGETWLLRASLTRQTPARNHIRALQDSLGAVPTNGRAYVQMQYALAKELEDVGDLKRAFHHVQLGAAARRRGMRYDVSRDVAVLANLRETFSAAAINGADRGGFPAREPIFVLGLPRTGSSLVERIITSHPDVRSAGELETFSVELMKLVRQGGHVGSRETLAPAALALDHALLGRNYIESTRPFTSRSPHFVDKLPLNSLNIGLIALALPQAKIVHVERDPMDTVYAMFKFLFANAYPFSYHLEELSHYVAAHRRLMDHWRAALPGRIITVRYEELVVDPEVESRRLVEGLELHWDPRCLNFHARTDAATTGSAMQVRERIYTSSIGSWQAVRAELGPACRILSAAGIGYE
jgi:tetratricopeptide (TPR) repeat protein